MGNDPPKRVRRRPQVCFFARVAERTLLDRVGFYAQDLAMLRDLGYDVHVATRISELRPADLFFVWWWTYAFQPLLHPVTWRKPVVITGTLNLHTVDARPLHQQLLLRFAIRRATLNVFHCRAEATAARDRFALNPLAAEHLGTAIDTARFIPAGPRNPHLVLTVAAMTGGNAVRKCLPEILYAMPLIHARHPKTRFVLAGEIDPAYTAMIRATALRDYVTVLGPIDQATKVRLMQSCAVYLQPSRFEGFGVAIAEALACGAPTVTSRVGQVPEVAGEGALYVDGTNPSDIAAGVSALLADPARGAAYGAMARQQILAHYTEARHRARWYGLLEPLIDPGFAKEMGRLY